MQKHTILVVNTLLLCVWSHAQNVGIGTSTPNYKLDVVGIIHSTSNAYFDGSVGIGTTSPGYKLQVNNGAIALYNTTDAKSWYFNYSSASNYFYLSEGGTNRMVVLNGGNVGIGTSTPAAKLDVIGSLHVDANATIDGSLTVNGGKGVAYNASSATNVKVYTFTTLKFTAILGPHQLSGEGSIGFGGGFTSTPKVFVGNEVLSGGTVGELHRVQLILYDCTTSSCKARLLNTSNGSVNYDIYWNILCVGN
jgi:hypothetical protein